MDNEMAYIGTAKVLSILLIITTTSSHTVEFQRTADPNPFGQFGQPCNSSKPCDRSSNLACQHGVCECSMPEIMIYDPDISKCLVKAGEKCKFLVEMDEIDRLMHHAEQVIMPCVGNATCSYTIESLQTSTYTRVCECNPGYYLDPRGQCWEKKKMGSECTGDNECEDEQGLICWDGYCGCDPNEARIPSVYGSRNICVGIPGSPCINYECELNSNCVDGTCICPHDFIWNEQEKRCKASFDKPCIDGSYCTQDLACINFRCKCKSFNQVFDMKLNRCLSIVGETCQKDEECVHHASCSNNYCRCDPGFMEFGPGFCRNGYMSVCMKRHKEYHYYVEAESLLGSTYGDFEIPKEENDNRQDNLLVIKISMNACDERRKLHCINGKCVCNRGVETFDEHLGRCLGLVGSLCKMYEHHSCIQNSECVPFTNLHKFGLGRCCCNNGFTPTGNRTCSENFISSV